MTPEQQIKYLLLEINRLKDEGTQLRKKLHLSSRHARRVMQAYQDAVLLSVWRVAGASASRSYAKKYGVSQNRWEAAMALLRMARIVTRHRTWNTTNATVIDEMLEKARERAIEQPFVFKARLNKHAQK